MFTTNTSGSSISPALMNWSTSPPPGVATKTSVSTSVTTSDSDCPTPTVSTNTWSKTGARIATPARAASEMPPRRSRAAIERRKAPGSLPAERTRIRSPSRAPPLLRLEGSTATIATLSARARSARTIASSRVDLPEPGAPVIPTRGAPGKGASRSRRSSSAWACARRCGRRSSHRFSASGAARSRASRRAARSGGGSVGPDTISPMMRVGSKSFGV